MNKIRSFLEMIFGRISWSCPAWLIILWQKIKANPKATLKILGILISVSVIVGYGYHWYKNLPQPRYVTATITPPEITPNAKLLVPDSVSIDFGIYGDPQSVAPIQFVGKEVTKNITLSPDIPGKWIWQSDSKLVFTPTNDWPADQTYKIHFDKKLFASHVKIDKLDYDFSTKPFVASIDEFKFYQDPVNVKNRQGVATVSFNYPVDTQSFENKATMALQNGEQFKLTFTYDQNKRIAYIHSESLPLPKNTDYLNLILDKGIKTTNGSAVTQEKQTSDVLLPDAGNYFKVARTSASIVRNEKNRPEQVITLETTLGVTSAELDKSLHTFLLPKDKDNQTDYGWYNPGEVTDDVLKQATPLTIQPMATDKDFATLHSYKFSAPPGRFIYLKIDKGVQGFGDFVLGKDFKRVLRVPRYPKEISFLHSGSLLALTGEKKLSVLVRGVPAAKFQIARVMPDNVNQLITQSEGDFNNPSFINPTFNENNISEIFSEVQNFKDDPAAEQYTNIDLGKYLSAKTNTGGPQGLFLLKAGSWDEKNKTMNYPEIKRLVLITDLGLIAKNNSDDTHEVYVASITRGVPVANASVSILGKNGVPLFTKTTDVQGRVSFPSLKDFSDEHEPVVYIARVGNDVSFIPYKHADRELNYSRYDTGGIYSGTSLQTLSAYVFSDRGLYRPGDTAHFGIVVKQAYAQPQPAGLPLEVTVTDPNGTTVRDQRMTLDSTGLLTFDFVSSVTARTGEYIVNLFIVKDNHPDNLLGTTTIRVEEFQPDRMRIKAQFSKENTLGWVSPTDLSAKVGLWNLYGKPATDRRITGKISLAPQAIQFSSYPDYTFVDPLVDPNKPQKYFSDNLTDIQSDSSGEAIFPLNLDRFGKSTYQLTFSTEGFEAGSGRSVTTEINTLVSPLDYFVGYKANDDLSYIKQDSVSQVNIIAVNPQLKKQAVPNLKIQLIALHPVSTLVKNDDGTYKYESITQSTIVSTDAFQVDEKGTNYTLPTKQIGDYIVKVFDQNNLTLAQFQYSVAGKGQLPIQKDAELSVKLNKAEYKAGEDIELQITAPYTGSGLITIERDKVYATQWFKTDNTNSIQKIHIPADFQGNGYINVAFIRDWNSPEIFVSPLSYSIVPFHVSHENQAIHIDLSQPELAMPGEPFTIKYKSDKPGKIIIFAVDKGILQVANYKTPKPLDFFFQKHVLEVTTEQILDQILPKFVESRELSSIGGDGGEEEALIRSHLNPFKRKTDLPVAFWSSILDTDSTERQVTYQVPDYFNGTLQVMAVAVSESAIGSTEKSSQIRGNFVINPNVPTFVAPGDEFEVTASIANNVKDSGKDAKVDVELSSSSELQIVGDSYQTLKIDEGQEQTVRYKVRARNLLGPAQLDFIAKIGDKSSKMSATLSVRPVNMIFTNVLSGISDSSEKSLKVDRDLYPEFRKVTAAASFNPMILLVGLQRYLDNFAYGCTEQLTSKVFPLVFVGNQSWLVDNTDLAKNKVAETIQMLGQRQKTNGGFSYWPGVGDYEGNAFASVYAIHFLTEAKAQGYDVPNDMLHQSLNYLKEYVEQDVNSLDDARLHAYAIYILTRNEIVTTNYLTHLQNYLNQDKGDNWQEDITSAYMAATYALLKDDKDAEKLIALYKPHKENQSYNYDFYDDNIADAEYLYLIANHFPSLLNKYGKDLVARLALETNSAEINTLLSSYTALAFNAYAQSLQATAPSLSIDEVLANKEKQPITTPSNVYLTGDVNSLAKEIIFNNPSKQTYFYQLSQSGFDKTPFTSVLKNKMEIYREFKDSSGHTITSANLGDEIEVHIQVRSLNDRTISNVAIVDLLPGGFEVVRDSVKNTGMDYSDVREDRVIFFGSVSPTSNEIVYRIKAINTGEYTVPPIFAESMYDQGIQAHGAVDKFEVK